MHIHVLLEAVIASCTGFIITRRTFDIIARSITEHNKITHPQNPRKQ